MAKITLELEDRDSTLFERYAQMHGMSVTEFMREASFQMIEDEIDLKTYDSAMAEERADEVSFSLGEVKMQLGID